ncbi:MAG: hypothetical protein C4523_09805 [Myxococcales bacterium]|nr:MAG: hypothetical protein C4523_09805 [Myxococcales bacterium]
MNCLFKRGIALFLFFLPLPLSAFTDVASPEASALTPSPAAAPAADATAPVETPAADAPAPAAEADTSALDGCRYDTQCKGERICVEGRCADPPAAGAKEGGESPLPVPAESETKPAQAYSGLTDARPPLIHSDSGVLFDLKAEYQFSMIYIAPLELNGEDVTDVFYGVQRGRTHFLLGWKNFVRLHTQIDLLDGVLFGDNGLVYGEPPYPNQGIHTAVRSPNNAGLTIALKDETLDPNDPDSYTYGLKAIEPIKLRRAWGEANILVGELRVGRMPAYEGRGIVLNDGDNDLNRFGPAGRGDTADRILFGTKPIEVVKAAMKGDPGAADSRLDRGLLFGFAYDSLVNDQAQFLGDDTYQFAFSLTYKLPEFALGSAPCGDLRAGFAYVYRTGEDIGLKLHIMALETSVRIENFRLETQWGVLQGETREISEAQSLFRTTGPGSIPETQSIKAWGMFAIADYDVGPVTLTFEVDYASGDDDPRGDSDLTQFYFAEDTKVGLLLFPQVLAFESARSAAAARYFVRKAEIPVTVETNANPSSQIETNGGFTNAIAIFPQVTWRIADFVFVRTGALLAWAAKPLIDPYATLYHYDADDLEDDKVNFNGGRPASFYGTEFDLRLSFNLWEEHFLFDLEGAVLLPGDALKDENGYAVASSLVQGRFTFRY